MPFGASRQAIFSFRHQSRLKKFSTVSPACLIIDFKVLGVKSFLWKGMVILKLRLSG